MTGPLSQLIVLTTYGNDYLINGSLPNDFSEHYAFRFCNKVDFREINHSSSSSPFLEEVIADDPLKWFTYLKEDGCKKLRLYFTHSKNQSLAKDYQLSAFVGGGGIWLMEAIENSWSNYWSNRWHVTDRHEHDQKIWTVNYGRTHLHQPTSDVQIDPVIIKAKLRQTLTGIESFASEQKLEEWAEKFAEANSALDDSGPDKLYYNKDLIATKNYSLTARQILVAAEIAWVFGGMGSWNDMAFENKDVNERYDRLSEKLYSDVIDAIISATNSF